MRRPGYGLLQLPGLPLTYRANNDEPRLWSMHRWAERHGFYLTQSRPYTVRTELVWHGTVLALGNQSYVDIGFENAEDEVRYGRELVDIITDFDSNIVWDDSTKKIETTLARIRDPVDLSRLANQIGYKNELKKVVDSNSGLP